MTSVEITAHRAFRMQLFNFKKSIIWNVLFHLVLQSSINSCSVIEVRSYKISFFVSDFQKSLEIFFTLFKTLLNSGFAWGETSIRVSQICLKNYVLLTYFSFICYNNLFTFLSVEVIFSIFFLIKNVYH